MQAEETRPLVLVELELELEAAADALELAKLERDEAIDEALLAREHMRAGIREWRECAAEACRMGDALLAEVASQLQAECAETRELRAALHIARLERDNYGRQLLKQAGRPGSVLVSVFRAARNLDVFAWMREELRSRDTRIAGLLRDCQAAKQVQAGLRRRIAELELELRDRTAELEADTKEAREAFGEAMAALERERHTSAELLMQVRGLELDNAAGRP